MVLHRIRTSKEVPSCLVGAWLEGDEIRSSENSQQTEVIQEKADDLNGVSAGAEEYRESAEFRCRNR